MFQVEQAQQLLDRLRHRDGSEQMSCGTNKAVVPLVSGAILVPSGYDCYIAIENGWKMMGKWWFNGIFLVI